MKTSIEKKLRRLHLPDDLHLPDVLKTDLIAPLHRRRKGSAAVVAGGVVVGGAAAVAAYAFFVRPWHLRWGTTAEEASKALPGDDLVAAPQVNVTRARTIAAPPEQVWPWLVQLGQDRGGFYSYDWLENVIGADIHNADRIVPAFQQLAVGDSVRLASQARYGDDAVMKVAWIEPNRVLVLRAPQGALVGGRPFDFTWTFVLEPLGDGRTRLLVRSRYAYGPGLRAGLANRVFLEPIHFVMERRMLLGIQARAEAAREVTVQAEEQQEPAALAAEPVREHNGHTRRGRKTAPPEIEA